MTASEREASGAPRKVWSCGEIGLTFCSPKALLGSVVDVDGVAFAVFGDFGFAVAFGFGCFEVVVVVVVVLITSAAEAEAEDLAGAKSALQLLNALIPEDAIVTVSGPEVRVRGRE